MFGDQNLSTDMIDIGSAVLVVTLAQTQIGAVGSMW